jgi:hypothetical protein
VVGQLFYFSCGRSMILFYLREVSYFILVVVGQLFYFSCGRSVVLFSRGRTVVLF